MAAYVVHTGVIGALLIGEDPFWAPTISRGMAVAAFLALAATDNRKVHWTLALFVLATNLWYTYVYTFLVAATPTGPV